MIAWNAYKATDEFANTRKWARHEQHVEGSLWAAFFQGFSAATPSPAPDDEALCAELEQKARGERNRVGDFWGDHLCAEAAARLRSMAGEMAEARRSSEHWHGCFVTLNKAVVGETGLSAIIIASDLRSRAEAAEAQVKAMSEALEPFDAANEYIMDALSDDYRPDWSPFIPYGAYRAARRARRATGGNDAE